MIKNWKLTVNLLTPLAGDPPALDSILEYEMAFRLGMKHARKMTRDIPLSDVTRPPIPLCRKTLSGVDVYQCSDPIVSETMAEWVEKQAKRFDTSKNALLLRPDQRKALLIASGPYKMRFAPVRVRLIKKVCWFFRGDRKEVNKIFKSIKSLGMKRSIGYGLIGSFSFEETENNYSLFANQHGKRVLMKTIPLCDELNGATGYRESFGGGFPPYWHPETFTEIAIPC